MKKLIALAAAAMMLLSLFTACGKEPAANNDNDTEKTTTFTVGFVAPFPPGRTHTSRKRSCSSRGDWSLNSVRRTEFLTRPLMVHQSTRCKKLQRVFYCNLSKKVQSGAPSGDENSSGPPPVRRAKRPQWGVFRARESPRWCTRKSALLQSRALFLC